MYLQFYVFSISIEKKISLFSLRWENIKDYKTYKVRYLRILLHIFL